MKGKSCKAKGSAFERYIAKELTACGLGEAKRELMSGGGWRKGDIYCPQFPLLIEAKNQRVYKLNQWIDQAKREAEQGFHNRDKWCLMLKDTRTPDINPTIYAVLDFYQLVELVKRYNEPVMKEPDRDMKFIISNLKTWLNKLDKKI